MKAIHAVNAVLWQPGEQIRVSQTNKQTNKQTNRLLYPWPPTRASGNKPTDYYTRGRPRAPRVIMIVVVASFSCSLVILAPEHNRSHISKTPGFFAVILVPTVHVSCALWTRITTKTRKVSACLNFYLASMLIHTTV